MKVPKRMEHIALAAGCFWCTEGILGSIRGVYKTEIGYGGGDYPEPDYIKVSGNPKGHSEITRIWYDSEIIGLEDILDVFFAIHDPDKRVSVNDRKGELYRSVIFFECDLSKRRIEAYISNKEKQEHKCISTELRPFVNYKKTKEKYQNYYKSNPDKPFCINVIGPKLSLLKDKGIL